MNVVRREIDRKGKITKATTRRNDNNAMGILATFSYNPVIARHIPHYNNENSNADAMLPGHCMGPPTSVPFQNRKRYNSTSSYKTDPTTSSAHNAVLANETVRDNSSFCTPKKKPNALRYISSSSRGAIDTKSARSTTTTTHSSDSSIILAISEGRGLARGEVGLAAIDLKHPHIVLCQLSDTLIYTNTLTKINYFNPVEIIVPHTFCEGQSTVLFKVISSTFPSIPIQKVQRRHFKDQLGLEQIQNLCAPQYSGVHLRILHKFYALTAAAAALKYIEFIQCIVFAQHSLKIEYHCSDQSMLIDIGTAEQLELVQPLNKSAGMQCCLMGTLGPVLTSPGARLMRATILQPSCNRELIEARLDCVQELIENDTGLVLGIQNVLKKLVDVDRILFLCLETQEQEMSRMCEAQLNQTLILKTTMSLVPNLIEALSIADSGRLRKIKMDLENPHYTEILGRIKNILMEDAHMEKGVMGTLQRCFAIKPDINGLLDVARRTYSELIDEMQKMVDHLGETYDMQIRMNQNMAKGFHIVLPLTPKERRLFSVGNLPAIFIQVQNNGTNVTMTTEDLILLDQQARESLSEIQNMSNIVIIGLLRELRPFMSSLYTLCEHVAELDLILALAQSSIAGSYVRPEFNDYLDIKESIHPLLEYNSQTNPISNNIFASPEYNFTIITGPNMGGKSIYIKQIATIQIMAQVGCFVPAKKAVLRLTDHLFSRMGFNDSVELNASTYVLEMKEMQYILKNITPTSLIVIDELCRGTSCEEGASIAWAICEELMLRNAFTFFTTHFLKLTRLQHLYHNVINLRTEVVGEQIPNTTQTRLVYKHRVERGVTNIQNYGLALAKRTNIPPVTLELADELAEIIAMNRQPNQYDHTDNIENEAKIVYKLNADIKMEMRKSDQPSSNIQDIVNKFKTEHPDIAEKLRQPEQVESLFSDKKNTTTTNSLNPITTSSDVNHSHQSAANLSPNINYDTEMNSIPSPEINNNNQRPPVLILSSETPKSSSHNTTSLKLAGISDDFDSPLPKSHKTNTNNVFSHLEDKNSDRNNADSFSNSIMEKTFELASKNLPPKIIYNSDNNSSMTEIETVGSSKSMQMTNLKRNPKKIIKRDEKFDREKMSVVLDETTKNVYEVQQHSLHESLNETNRSFKTNSESAPLNLSEYNLLLETVEEINKELEEYEIESRNIPPPRDFLGEVVLPQKDLSVNSTQAGEQLSLLNEVLPPPEEFKD